MIKPVVFSSESKNFYVYSTRMNQLLLVHPLVAFFLQLEEQGIKPHDWYIANKSNPLKINGFGIFRIRELKYYLKKYSFLYEYGYLRDIDFSKRLSASLTHYDVDRLLCQVAQLTFEVTEACNLRCEYCCFGALYKKHDKRRALHMDFRVAMGFLDVLFKLRKKGDQSSRGKDMLLSFYRGEPLLNLPLIQAIVENVKQRLGTSSLPSLRMTTNGTLIAEHAGYLRENDFVLNVSLDGDENGHSYRKFHNGAPSYQTVYRNMMMIKEKYPDYFQKNVEFLSVLHDKNSSSELHAYFKENFSKSTMVMQLTTGGITDGKKFEFLSKFKSHITDFRGSVDYEELKNDLLVDNPEMYTLARFLLTKSGFFFENYKALLIPENCSLLPGGTCLPFSRRIFLSARGKILPCEKVDHKYNLAQVNEGGATIDVRKVTEQYNERYNKLRKVCQDCYRTRDCSQCMFHMEIDDESPKCPNFATYQSYASELSDIVSYLERSPNVYRRILNEVTII